MAQKVLYLMLGYPGSGKTTTSKYLHELTGAVHLWADHIRRERYGTPAYTHKENLDLYGHINQLTGELLAAGNSVIFDTNFNFYKDRQHLRQIAAEHDARAVLIWVSTPKKVAKERATDGAHKHTTRVLGDMSDEVFERMSGNLQEPKPDEDYISVDGTHETKDSLRNILQQNQLL